MRVLVHYDRPELFSDLLTDRFPDVELTSCKDYASFGKVMADVRPEALFVIKFEVKPYPRDPIFEVESLKWINIGGVGVDHIHPWNPEILTVTNGVGVGSDVMADYAIGAVTALSMRLPFFARQQQQRKWKARNVESLQGKTLTVVGLGHVGRAIAKRAAALGLRVVGTRANPQPTENVELVFGPEKLHEALALGDFVFICAPLLPETRYLIDESAFAAMKDGAHFVDISRGGVVEARALIAALESEKLAGAILDVFEHEPMPQDCPLWDMENVNLSPHVSALTAEMWEGRRRVFKENLRRFLSNEPFLYVCDKQAGF